MLIKKFKPLLKYFQRIIFKVLLAFSLFYLGLEDKATAEQLLPDSVQLQTFLDRGNFMFSKNNVDSASYFFTVAEALAKKINNNKGLFNSRGLYQKILIRQRKYKEALDLSEENFLLCKELNDQISLANGYQNLGMSYFFLMNYPLAVTNFIEGLKIAENIQDFPLQQSLNTNLAMVYITLKEKNYSLIYTEKAYEVAVYNKDTIGIARNLTYFALIDLFKSNHYRAIDYLQDVIAMEPQLLGTRQIAYAYTQLGKVYNMQQDYDAALQAYFRGLKNPFPVKYDQTFLYAAIAESYFNMEAYEQAYEYFSECLKAPEIINSSKELRDFYLLGARISNKLNLIDLSFEYLQQHKVLNDSLTEVEDQENFLSFESQYQAAEKEKSLTEQKLAIAQKNVEIQKKNNLLFMSFSIVIGLIFCILIFVIIYRNKQKVIAEKLLFIEKQNEIKVLTAMMEGEEKERSRLARELHDGVGGILSATKMHLSILKNGDKLWNEKLEQPVSLIDYASQEIRNIAHNLSPTILLNSQLEKVVAHFCTSVSNSSLQVDCYIMGEMPKFNNSFKLIVYRIIQELINNIIKHSHANHALVQLSHFENVLAITVEDNGVGFEFNETDGIGLSNLKERVKNMNGFITIKSEIDNGTTIYMEFNTSSFIIFDSLLEPSIV